MAGGTKTSTKLSCLVVVFALCVCVSAQQDVKSLCRRYARYCTIWKTYIDIGYKSLQVYYDLCECWKQDTSSKKTTTTTTTTTRPTTTTTTTKQTPQAQCGYPPRYCSIWRHYITAGYKRLQDLYDRCRCDKQAAVSTTTSSSTVTSTTSTTTPTTTTTTTTISPTSATPPQQCGISSLIDDPSAYLSRPTGRSALRIVGGNPATDCEFPWMAYIRIDERRLCTGSLLDSRHVITAGHCVTSVLTDWRSVRVGLGSSNKNTMQYFSVSRVFRHPGYTRNFDNDISIMRLDRPVTYSKCVRPICLAEKPVYLPVGTVCLASGWGILSESSIQRPDVLQKVKLPIMSQSACSRVYDHYGVNMICAGLPEGGKDACLGDSGGPLSCAVDKKWVMIGAVSYGMGCARPGYPGVYTYLPNYYSWIDSVRNL